VVERDLAKVDVAGSTPVSRSRFHEEPVSERAFCVSADRALSGGHLPRITLI
jgi:hypothetical protein